MEDYLHFDLHFEWKVFCYKNLIYNSKFEHNKHCNIFEGYVISLLPMEI